MGNEKLVLLNFKDVSGVKFPPRCVRRGLKTYSFVLYGLPKNFGFSDLARPLEGLLPLSNPALPQNSGSEIAVTSPESCSAARREIEPLGNWKGPALHLPALSSYKGKIL